MIGQMPDMLGYLIYDRLDARYARVHDIYDRVDGGYARLPTHMIE